MPFFFFGRKFIAGRSWEILKNFIKYIKNFSKIFKKFWELDRKIFSTVWVSPVRRPALAWKAHVKRLLHFFTHLHNYETFRHIYTCQSSEQLDFFELAWVLHGKAVGRRCRTIWQPDNLTTLQAQQSLPFIGKQCFRRTASAFLLTILAKMVLCNIKLASHLI